MKTTPLTLASKSIRAELHGKYPETKFSVRSSRYSGGTSIYVTWTGGPGQKDLYPVVEKYQEGTFDGMTDRYVFDENPQHKEFRRLRGSAKYVVLQRRRA